MKININCNIWKMTGSEKINEGWSKIVNNISDLEQMSNGSREQTLLEIFCKINLSKIHTSFLYYLEICEVQRCHINKPAWLVILLIIVLIKNIFKLLKYINIIK